MVTLLIAVTLGVIFAIFGTQNTGPITLNFGDYTLAGIPTYLAVLTPLLIGLFMALLFHFARDFSQKLVITEQKEGINKLKVEMAQTRKAAHKFQVENIKLKKDYGLPRDPNSI